MGQTCACSKSGAVSLPILGLDVSTFYGRCYLCADYVCVMDNVCHEALSGPYLTYCAKHKYDG